MFEVDCNRAVLIICESIKIALQLQKNINLNIEDKKIKIGLYTRDDNPLEK